MAGIPLYDATIKYWLHGMQALKNILEIANKHSDAASFPSAQLIGDMKPLTFQVQSCSNNAKMGTVRLTGREVESWADDETTMDQLMARVDKTIALLEGVKPSELEAVEKTQQVELKLPSSTTHFTPAGYALGFAIPNFTFHLAMAYAVLRMKGVDVGKMSYLQSFMGPNKKA